MAETVSVTELNTRVKELFSRSEGLNDIWVAGELSNVKLYASGHYYFTIKDSGSEIRGVMFRSSRARIDFEPADSLKVQAFGHVDMYVERGSYQFIAETMRVAGTGDLYLQYEKLKKQLEAEGLFDTARKRPLPVYPKVIGVVTSPSGAVIHDIITTTRRRFPVDILLAPAQVQGEGAAASVVAGIQLLNRVGVDVIIVGRGGGSIEDLWAFNEEPVARAIAASRVPVISSVGHETDFTIADFVADVRAATPTAAAELAVRDRHEVVRQLDDCTLRLNKALTAVSERRRARFQVLDSRLAPKRAQELVGMLALHLDELSARLAAALGNRVGAMHRRFVRTEGRLDPAARALLAAKRAEAAAASARLEALSPYSVLSRGYSFVAGSDGRAITSVKGLSVGSLVTVRMRDGRAAAEVKEKEEFHDE